MSRSASQISNFASLDYANFGLSDDELREVMTLAGPVCPRHRDEFLKAVAGELAAQPKRGPWVVREVALRQQRRMLTAPAWSGAA
jgi:hypothetical protein